MSFVETERLILRHLTPADIDSLVALDSDPSVMRYLTGGRPTPRQRYEDELMPRFLHEYATTKVGRFATIERATGTFLGWHSLDPVSVTEAELGYRLGSAAWGKGYGTEGSRALIDKAFAELGLERIFAQTMAVNTGSRRVMEKSGLSHVRTFHPAWDDPIAGSEHGEVEYEITLEQWRSRQRPGHG